MTRSNHHPRRLKPALQFVTLLLALSSAHAEETPPGEALRQGLYQEEVKRDPEAAAKQYAEIIAAEDRRRATVATAIFRLAEVRRGQGKKDEAVALYQKLLREFPQAAAEGKLARDHLTALGGKIPEAGAAAVDEEMVQIERIRNLMIKSPDRANVAGEMEKAVVNNQAKVLRFLLDSGAVPPEGLLDSAARKGQLACLNTLLEVAKDQVASQRGLALATAAAVGHVEIVKSLLKAGADINWQPEKAPKAFEASQGNYNWVVGTPLTTALRFEKSAVVDLLLEAKPDVRLAAKPTGLTALHAALLHNKKYAERLLDLGADVNALASLGFRNKEGEPEIQSPLQIAAYSEFWEVATLLVKRGANLRQPGLLAPFLTNYCEPKKRAEILRFLLDAGADPGPDPGPDPYPILALVAQVDDDGSRTTKLLTNSPAPPDLKKLPDMYPWQPKARQAFLATAVYPALAKLPGVKLLFADTGVWKTAWDPTQGGEPPSAFELVWENRDAVVSLSESAKQNREAFRHLGCIMLRPQPDGSCVEVEKHGGPDTIPLDRDLIVISRSDRGRVENDGVYQEFRRQVTAQLRQMVAFPVTLEIGGEAREIRLRGDRLVFDPTVAEAPLLNAGPLARLFLPTTGPLDRRYFVTGALRIQRKGWTDITLDLSSPEVEQFSLRRGDKLILAELETPTTLARPVDSDGKTAPRQTVVTTPGLPFVRVLGVMKADYVPGKPPSAQTFAAELPTLLEAITDCYAGPAWSNGDDSMMSMFFENKAPDYAAADDQALFRLLSNQTPAIILPHPDFSAIRIRRLGKDGKETIIKVDLAAEIARCTDATDPAKAREADRPLQPGDIVEVPLKPAKDQPWTGLAAPEVRFFRKALTRRILVNLDNEISPMELIYQPPRWRQTAFGLLPLPPATGFATFRLSQVDMLLDNQFREEERKRMASASFGGGSSLSGGSILLRGDRNLSNYSDTPDRDPFVRDGDTVNARYPNHAPRPRVVAPPTPPGAQPSTQPIPRPTRR